MLTTSSLFEDYANLFQAMPEGIVVQDPDGRIKICNPRAEEILGLSREQMTGLRSIDPNWRAVHEDGSEFPGENHPAMVALRTGKEQRNVLMGVHRPDGSRVWININSSPVYDNLRGRLTGVISTFSDVTAIKRTERRYRFALDAMDEGLWDLDFITGELYLNDRWHEIFGFQRDSFTPDARLMVHLIHPEDRYEARQALWCHLRNQSDVYNATYRMQNETGEYRWIQDRGKVIEWDERRRPRRMIGTQRDITQLRELQRGLQINHARLKNLIMNFDAAILVEDEHRKILLVNQKFCDVFGIPARPEMLIGVDCSRAADQARHLFLDPKDFVTQINELLVHQKKSLGEELLTVRGQALERDYIPIFFEGEYRGHMWIYRDITERKNYQDMITHKAFHDYLTGLPNRDFFLQKLADRLKPDAAQSDRFSIFYMDLNGFKQVNDTYGHAAGDELLKAVAQRLKSVLRENDLLARMGGDEFALLLNADPESESAQDVAERIIVSIQKPFTIGAHSIIIGICVGISVHPGDGADPRTLLHHADLALYAARARGHNQMHFFQAIDTNKKPGASGQVPHKIAFT